MLTRELDDLRSKGNTICIGIAAVATPPAQFPSEEMVYQIADQLLECEYAPGQKQEQEGIPLPEKRIFLDLVEEVRRPFR